MDYPPDQAAAILKLARDMIDKEGSPSEKLPNMWRTVGAIYGVSMSHAVRAKIGDNVYSGPFKGMKLPPSMFEGNFGPRLLGCYEHELHQAMERVIAERYNTILNIGCAYGYYSVGLALRMPNAEVYAFDISPKAQQDCGELATLNGVSDRVRVAGEFRGEDFAQYASRNTLLLLDIEGGERTLLDPVKWPALRKLDVIVELHECDIHGISDIITQRFSATHDIEMVFNRSIHFPLEEIFGSNIYLEHFANMAVTFEGRAGATPWAVMRRITI